MHQEMDQSFTGSLSSQNPGSGSPDILKLYVLKGLPRYFLNALAYDVVNLPDPGNRRRVMATSTVLHVLV